MAGEQAATLQAFVLQAVAPGLAVNTENPFNTEHGTYDTNYYTQPDINNTQSHAYTHCAHKPSPEAYYTAGPHHTSATQPQNHSDWYPQYNNNYGNQNNHAWGGNIQSNLYSSYPHLHYAYQPSQQMGNPKHPEQTGQSYSELDPDHALYEGRMTPFTSYLYQHHITPPDWFRAHRLLANRINIDRLESLKIYEIQSEDGEVRIVGQIKQSVTLSLKALCRVNQRTK